MSGTDQIRIKDLRLRCIIGTHAQERRRKQDVVIQVTMDADLAAASRSDELKDTVDYQAVKERIVKIVEASSYQLIERLAGRIAQICLAEPRVRAVEVEVEKPGVLHLTRAVSVVLRRKRA